jgi:hypothetical protein
MNRILSLLVLPAAFVAGFAGVALAAGVAEIPEESLGELLRPIIDAVLAGDYWLAGAAALIFATTAAYRYLPRLSPRFAFVASTPGKALTLLLVSYGGALAASLVGAATMSPALAFAALKVALAAAGGYSVAKAVVYPLLAWLETKAPGWMAPVISVLLWAFRSGDPDAAAEKAGDEAVDADPPDGTAGIVGKPTEVE